MVEVKWTPGPHSVLDTDGGLLLIGPGYQHLATINRYYSGERAGRNVANANLYAAAPAMAEALLLNKAYEDTPQDRGGPSGPKGQARAAWIAARDTALAALSAARGE